MDAQFGRIRFIRGDNGGKYPFSHSVYLEGRDCRVVIDPSCSMQKLSDLKQKEGVDQVWLSHWHEDHMAFLNFFEGCPLRISERDFQPLTDMEIFLDWYGIKEAQLRELWKNIMLNNFNLFIRKILRCLNDCQYFNFIANIRILKIKQNTAFYIAFNRFF